MLADIAGFASSRVPCSRAPGPSDHLPQYNQNKMMKPSISTAFSLLLTGFCGSQAFQTYPSFVSHSSASAITQTCLGAAASVEAPELHPAVAGWPQKYADEGGDMSSANGPRILSTEFDVHQATEEELSDLDVKHWPTWSTDDKAKWAVGNQVVDKEMPYGELSYVISGKLEIIPQSTGVPVIVNVGDFVTFPQGFVASWKVLEELTWHYYLY